MSHTAVLWLSSSLFLLFVFLSLSLYIQRRYDDFLAVYLIHYRCHDNLHQIHQHEFSFQNLFFALICCCCSRTQYIEIFYWECEGFNPTVLFSIIINPRKRELLYTYIFIYNKKFSHAPGELTQYSWERIEQRKNNNVQFFISLFQAMLFSSKPRCRV